MAVLAIFTGPITKDQYEKLRKIVDWEGKRPAGAVFHAASFDETGNAHVADVWESAEALDAFVGQRLMPAFQQMGFTPPQVEVYPAHNVNAFTETIEKYKV